MNRPEDTAAAVARLTGALERQAEELRHLRSQLGLSTEEATRLLRPDDVAARLSTSRAWVYRNQQALGGFRVGGQLRFEPEVVDQYLEQCQGRRTPPAEAVDLLPIGPSSKGRGRFRRSQT